MEMNPFTIKSFWLSIILPVMSHLQSYNVNSKKENNKNNKSPFQSTLLAKWVRDLLKRRVFTLSFSLDCCLVKGVLEIMTWIFNTPQSRLTTTRHNNESIRNDGKSIKTGAYFIFRLVPRTISHSLVHSVIIPWPLRMSFKIKQWLHCQCKKHIDMCISQPRPDELSISWKNNRKEFKWRTTKWKNKNRLQGLKSCSSSLLLLFNLIRSCQLKC